MMTVFSPFHCPALACRPRLAAAHLLSLAAVALLYSASPAYAQPSSAAPKASSGATTWVRHFALHTRLALPAAESFALLDEPHRQALSDLSQRSELLVNVYTRGDRLLMVFPANHPAAEMEVLLADDTGELAIALPRPKVQELLPRQRLADVLDRAPPSARSVEEVVVGIEASEATLPPGEPGHRLEQHTLRVGMSYRTRSDKGRGFPVSLTASFATAAAPGIRPYQDALWALGLPLLQCPEGEGVLHSLSQDHGAPQAWWLLVENEGKKSGAPAQWATRVFDHGFTRLSPDRLATARPGYTIAPRLPTPHTTARQVVEPQDLARLRPASATGPLEVKNLSRHAALVYADGVLVGWVLPGGQLEVEGLPDGFYRVFAASPTGVRSWGPWDAYLPGPITLR